MPKEQFIAAHEDLIEEYLETHPHADWSQAYEATGDNAHERMRDRYADMADAARQHQKDEG